MDQNRNGLVPLGISELSRVVLLGSDLAHHDWVDALKVRWIGEHFASHLLTVWIGSGETGTKMVLDVT